MTGDNGGGPTGNERMRRRTPSDLSLMPKRTEHDPKKAYQKKQLAEMAVIAILWNQIEAQVNYLGSHILFYPGPFYLQLEANKTIGTPSKLKLLRKCAAHARILDQPAKKCIEVALNAYSEFSTYRNALIHHHIYDPKKGIATYVDQSGKSYQILVTYEALSGLYTKLTIYHHELIALAELFLMEIAPDSFSYRDANGEKLRDQRKLLHERAIPDATRRVVERQNKRLSLPPLPLFPDAHRVRPKTVAAKSHPRSAEKDRGE